MLKKLSHIIFLSSGLVAVVGQFAAAQNLSVPSGNGSRPVLGGTSGLRPPRQPPLLKGSENNTVKLHLSPTGRPCLAVFGHPRAQAINRNIFEHIILVTNNCSQLIKIEVCYYKSEHCIRIDVPGYARKEAVLGIYPLLQDFRYEYREQF